MIVLGHRHSNGAPEGIERIELLRHLYVLGKTGSGKSTVLSRILTNWLEAGAGACLVDPHGDLVHDLLARLPRSRARDVVVVDPADQLRPIAWNPLYRVPVNRRPVVAQGLVAAFRGVWSDSWGPRMEYILANSLRLLLDAEVESLLGLPRLLTDHGYRQYLLNQCTDPIVSRFWRTEFEAWDDRFRKEAVAPIQNKIGQFLSDPLMRSILGQRRSKLDLRQSMDNGKILLVNLSKGMVGEATSNLFGALLVASIHEAALSRADIPESLRKPFLLVIDEFQNITTIRMASALSEARKYGLGLVLSHQFLDQLLPELRSAVLGNAGSMLVFRLGGADAEDLATELGPDWPPHRFTDLSAFRAILLVGVRKGLPVPAIIETLTQGEPIRHGSEIERIVLRSRERFGREGHQVARRIEQWLARDFGSRQRAVSRHGST